MNYEIISEGFVSQRTPGGPTSIAAGSRCVQARNGEVVCTFVAQSVSGGNDFKPMIARSGDGGLSWSEAQPLWPEIQDRFSIFGSISAAPSGDFHFFGMRTPIDHPGELAWSDATKGLKQNELVWARSGNSGHTWSPFSVIPMPIAGSAEAAGAMCLTRAGHMVCCYAPYNTFDPALRVQQNQVICLVSRNNGRSWQHSTMLRFSDVNSVGAESWVVELSDGRLLGTGWHILGDTPQMNKYAISQDGGATWGPTGSTGTLGQSTALAPLPDGRALFVYNQRKQGDIGVWLAVARPTESDFGLLANQRIWAAEVATRGNATADFKDWTSFAFGEPSVTPLSDGTLLITLWALQPSGHGIRYVKLRIL
ncbi:MAG: hypothetical protein JWM88_2416 [Verrucomicrobia bacterium]|nr:hypothetical protein [Verrucomicrobiota bacterium]